MAWTTPTAVFFAAIAVMLVAMTALELVRPTELRRGFLPIPTTRGDRLFIGLLSTAFIHLLWLASGADAVWPATVLALVWFAALMRWG